MSDCGICRRVEMAESGRHPSLIHEFPHSYFVLGDHQYFKGYSLLLFKRHVRELHELPARTRAGLFEELMAAGQAVFDAFHPWKMNYSCYGNLEPHIHWHIFPRTEEEPDHFRPPWQHSQDFGTRPGSDAERAEAVAKIRAALL